MTFNNDHYLDHGKLLILAYLSVEFDKIPFKGYCTAFPLFPEIFLINRSS